MKKVVVFIAICFVALTLNAQYYYYKPTMWDNIKSTQLEIGLGGGTYFGTPSFSSNMKKELGTMEYRNLVSPSLKIAFELETSRTGWYFGTFTDLAFSLDGYEASFYGEAISEEEDFLGKRYTYTNAFVVGAFNHGFKVGCFFNDNMEFNFGAGAQLRYSILDFANCEVTRVNNDIEELSETYSMVGRMQLSVIGRLGFTYRLNEKVYVGASIYGDIYPISLGDDMIDWFNTDPTKATTKNIPEGSIKIKHESRRNILAFLSIGYYWNKKPRPADANY